MARSWFTTTGLTVCLVTAGCGLEPGFNISWQGDSQSTVGVVLDDQEALRLAYQSCQNDPTIEAPLPAQSPINATTASSVAMVGARSRGLSTHFRFQQGDSLSDPTGLRDFGAEAQEISLFTVEEGQEILARSRQRAKLAASAAALDPYWQPLSTAQSIEEGGNQVGLDDLRERKSANGQDGGSWNFEQYNGYWDSRDIPLIRQTINQYCRQAATRMGIDF